MIGSPGYPVDEGRVAGVARRSFARGNDPAGVARQYAAIVVSPDRSPGLRALTIPPSSSTARTIRSFRWTVAGRQRSRCREPAWWWFREWDTTCPSSYGRG